jgi:hypothetical protein
MNATVSAPPWSASSAEPRNVATVHSPSSHLHKKPTCPATPLTQRHTDLKNEFYQCVKERGGPSEDETRLRATITKLRVTIDNKNRELQQLRADVPALVRVVNQLTLENEQLRDQLEQPTDVVIALPKRRV